MVIFNVYIHVFTSFNFIIINKPSSSLPLLSQPAGKTYTMLGNPYTPHSLGVIPCAISWLFWLIGEQKSNTGARFSVRVSAVEVVGKQENVVDLLKDQASCKCMGL